MRALISQQVFEDNHKASKILQRYREVTKKQQNVEDKESFFERLGRYFMGKEVGNGGAEKEMDESKFVYLKDKDELQREEPIIKSFACNSSRILLGILLLTTYILFFRISWLQMTVCTFTTQNLSTLQVKFYSIVDIMAKPKFFSVQFKALSLPFLVGLMALLYIVWKIQSISQQTIFIGTEMTKITKKGNLT